MSIDRLTMTEIAEGFERMFERAAGTAVCGCGKVLRGARRRFCAEGKDFWGDLKSK